MFDLFCLPFAGGNKFSYRELEKIVPSRLRIIPFEYPGHGLRVVEKVLTNLEMIAEDLYEQAIRQIGDNNYAIFGHSMGGILAWLLTKKLMTRKPNSSSPAHLFISGTPGPSSSSIFSKRVYLLNKTLFWMEIQKLDDRNPELFRNQEFIDYIEPILRSDFEALETFSYSKSIPLNIPMTVISGRQDETVMFKEVALWQKETIEKIDFVEMDGKHFFIFPRANEVIQIILRKLMLYI